jgi:hypothetical protein
VADTKERKERKRKPAKPAKTAVVTGYKKISQLAPLDLHRKLVIASSITGRKREDIVLDAIRDAVDWVVIQDHRKTVDVPAANQEPAGRESPASQVTTEDRNASSESISPPTSKAA